MMNYADKSIDVVASEIIVSTCQLRPKSYYPVSECMHDLYTTLNTVATGYWISCGSSAEFYIQPLNTCIGDWDHLTCRTDQLVFSGEYPVLPSDLSGLSETIKCHKIEPYHKYPGFVRLLYTGDMNYNWYYKRYRYECRPNRAEFPNIYVVIDITDIGPEDRDIYRHVYRISPLPYIVCGPAIKSLKSSASFLSVDNVKGMFCPGWPDEANNWPIRPRKHGFPTINTISEVVQNGCHVVYAQHRFCRDDRLQWRLSFSFAEAILLKSWTKTQQIVYHLLRFFAKGELIQKDCPKEDEVLCPYHLKTLMLWICEEMPSEWWNSSTVIGLSSQLLQKLSKWLKMRYCPNYFIPEANLFHEPSNIITLHRIERQLNDFNTPQILSQWFLENYIQPITETQFKFLYRTKVVLHSLECILPLFEHRKKNELKSLTFLLFIRLTYASKTYRLAIKYGLSSGLYRSLSYQEHGGFCTKFHTEVTSLSTVENVLCVRYYDEALCILHTAYGLCFGTISWEGSLFVEAVNTISKQPIAIRSHHHNFPKMYTEQSCRFKFMRAQRLMQNLTGSNSHSEFQLVSHISTEYLVKALEYEDSQFSGIAPAACAYLAALYFARSEYQQAIHFCSAVLFDRTYQKQKEALNASSLLFIDDVARIVGLYLLRRVIAYNNLTYIGRRLYLDLRLSPKVFCHFIATTSAERTSNHLGSHCNLPHTEFSMDECLKTLYRWKYIDELKSRTFCSAVREIVYLRMDSMTDKTVINLLMECALEKLTSFYSLISKDFGLNCNTAECYRALYLYKSRQYERVLRLCEQISCEPETNEFPFANVLLLPPLDSFFDGGIQSLLGCHVLQCFLSPLNDETRESVGRATGYSNYKYWFGNNENFLRFRLLAKLPDCYVTCNYFLGRHFLARYLRVRCCIDCHLPYSEALTEFAAQKTCHPFEQVIRRFLLRKIRNLVSVDRKPLILL